MSTKTLVSHYRTAALVTAVLAFVVIVLGAAVRVNDAGISCPDWPTCYGHWFPFPAPEGGFVGDDGIHYQAYQVFLEWVHRLLASITGFSLLVTLICAIRARAAMPRLWKITTLAVLAMLVQIKLGGVTVLMDNISWTVALHLGNAMVFYGLVMLGLMAASRPAKLKPLKVDSLQKAAAWAMVAMVMITLLLGATVSTSGAGPACGGLFSCHGQWLPSEMLGLLHMQHRYAAVLTFLTALGFFTITRSAPKELARTGRVLVIFVLVQAALGIATLYSFEYYFQLYHWLSVTHLAWATVVWTVALTAVVKAHWGAKDPAVKFLLHR